jgi:tetratricopeptide (TPR) repeat protein
MRQFLASLLLVATGAAWAAAPPAKLTPAEHDALVRAQALNKEGVALQNKSRYQEAEKPFREGLGIWRKVLGERHPFTATSYNNLADSLAFQGRLGEALPLFQRALAIRLEL